jgi:hypothetical protein
VESLVPVLLFLVHICTNLLHGVEGRRCGLEKELVHSSDIDTSEQICDLLFPKLVPI